jgi:hypothetical protein
MQRKSNGQGKFLTWIKKCGYLKLFTGPDPAQRFLCYSEK